MTGYDPAGPIYNTNLVPRLKSTSCKIVYVIHTNTILFGYSNDCGTIDIYVNGGEEQPNCDLYKSTFCSHWRSVFLDISARRNPNKFFITSSNKKYKYLDYLNTPPGKYSMRSTGCSPYFLKNGCQETET